MKREKLLSLSLSELFFGERLVEEVLLVPIQPAPDAGGGAGVPVQPEPGGGADVLVQPAPEAGGGAGVPMQLAPEAGPMFLGELLLVPTRFAPEAGSPKLDIAFANCCFSTHSKVRSVDFGFPPGS